ncbi:MAG TPA: hypothetical protein VLS25_10280, partial [Dehalococcoidia bacterium]|nr:hypothetical protein [Dehalococcoidia bacterium]
MSDTAATGPDYAPAIDLFGDLRRLKVWTQAGVYMTIVLFALVYHFLLQLETAQLLAVTGTVFLLAFCAIEGAFASSFKMRRRLVYPNVLVAEMGAAGSVSQASQRALSVLQFFFRPAYSLVAAYREGSLQLVVGRGMDPGRLEEFIRVFAEQIGAAADSSRALSMGPEQLQAWDQAAAARNAVILPLVAFGRCVGVLVLAVPGAHGPLKDRSLLAAISEYVGISLEGLRQREELRTGQERNRALLSAIPDGMIRLNRDGIVVDYKSRNPSNTDV